MENVRHAGLSISLSSLGVKLRIMTERVYLVDREAIDHLVSMLRDGVESGASDEEISEQTFEILDANYRKKTDQSLREMHEGKVKRFKNAQQMIRDLQSS